MIGALDARTRQFYMEMGYSEQQVARAHEYALRKKVDMLDALALPLSSTQPPPPPVARQPGSAAVGSAGAGQAGSSFLVGMGQLRGGEWEVLYSRSGKVGAVGQRWEAREAGQPVGLLNVSNCCYLNSLLQCYFLMRHFQQILQTADPLPDIAALLAENRTKLKRVKGEYELLAKLKHFFTLMALTSKKYLDPTDVLQNLVDSVGEKLTYGEEKDLSEINIIIIERLSEGLTFSNRYFRREEPEPNRGSFIDEGEGRRYNSIFNPESGVIKKLFYGTKVEYYRGKGEKGIQSEGVVSDFAGIILNPRFGTLQSALQEQFNFTVQINGQTFEKQMFIREQPEYLFLYINRTAFDRHEQLMHKNHEKLTFDFILYLDPYMERHRQQQGQNDHRRRTLVDLRNKVREQISALQMLAKKVEECHQYARELEGWAERLPREEELEGEGRRLGERLAMVERELQEVESRREEYHLMYIFVHRGDAVSGHYWGYGRNGAHWYRFDVNCAPLPQEQILIDIENSAGTPYALLYVKQQNIPDFPYRFHTRAHMHSQLYPGFDEKLTEQIIRDNILLHQEVQNKSNEIIKKKCLADYVARYNALKKTAKRLAKPKEASRLDSLPLANNFTLFLQSKGEAELFKFTIFEQSLLAASGGRVSVDQLLHEGELLAAIQKKFKLKCKGELHLKNYAIVGKDQEKYLRLQEEYQLTAFEVAWTHTVLAATERLLPLVEKLNLKGEFVGIELEGAIGAAVADTARGLRTRALLLRTEEYAKVRERAEEPLYITQVNNEVAKLIMLKLVLTGFRFEALNSFTDLSDPAGAQIAAINSANGISIASLALASSLSPVEDAQELVRRFHVQSASGGRKGSINDSASKERRTSTKNSSESSPFKSSLGRGSSLREKRGSEVKLTNLAKIALLLDVRESWKTEELESALPNYDLSARILSFLRRSASVVRVYRRAQQLSRVLTAIEVGECGAVLNQRVRQEQSLI